VERERHASAREERAEEAQGQEAAAQIAADVQVDDVCPDGQKEPDNLERGAWIVHVVSVASAVSRQIDHRSGDVVTAQVLADRDQIRLDAAVRRRVRAQL
jgi:hypothetical protein